MHNYLVVLSSCYDGHYWGISAPLLIMSLVIMKYMVRSFAFSTGSRNMSCHSPTLHYDWSSILGLVDFAQSETHGDQSGVGYHTADPATCEQTEVNLWLLLGHSLNWLDFAAGFQLGLQHVLVKPMNRENLLTKQHLVSLSKPVW